MAITIWHNNSCGSSRNALAYLREKGQEPEVFFYLKEKPDAGAIRAVLDQLAMNPSELLRPKDAVGQELGLYEDGVSEDRILEAMAQNARLIQRPIVITDRGAVIARPKDRIDEIL